MQPCHLCRDKAPDSGDTALALPSSAKPPCPPCPDPKLLPSVLPSSLKPQHRAEFIGAGKGSPIKKELLILMISVIQPKETQSCPTLLTAPQKYWDGLFGFKALCDRMRGFSKMECFLPSKGDISFYLECHKQPKM